MRSASSFVPPPHAAPVRAATAVAPHPRRYGPIAASGRQRRLLVALVLVVGFAWLVAGTDVRGQSGTDLYGSARASALGGATTALIGDAGTHANPGVRSLSSARSLVLYARQDFGLAELRYGSAHVDLPLRHFAVSASASTFGFADYREIHAGVGLATAVGLGTTRRLGLGVQTRYHHLRIERFGRTGATAVNAGLAVRLVPTFTFGAHATNLFGARLGDGAEVPKTLAVGLAYDAADTIRVVADAFKDVDFPLSLRGGIELQPVPFVAVRAGANSSPVRFGLGTGVQAGPLRADVAAERHDELGWSPSASLTILW